MRNATRIEKNSTTGTVKQNKGKTQSPAKNGGAKALEQPAMSLKEIEFRFKAPTAEVVRLAGDFTDWDQSAIQMARLADGTWFTSVPLSPGVHSYRFIMDGRWVDDPRADKHAPNPFGTRNAIIQVVE